MVKLVLLLVVGISFLGSLAHAADGRPTVGKKKVSMCVGCHGIPGYRTVFPDNYPVPKLGGQHADYLASALKAYRSGDRQHPTMNSVSASLSDQDVADIAAYFARTDK